MRMPGMGELVVVLLVVVVLFGAKKLPQLGHGIGKGLRNLKRGLERDDELDVTPVRQRLVAESGAQVVTEVRTARD